MSKILSTDELRRHINNFIKRLNDILNQNIKLSNIFFKEGFDSSPEGTYIFTNERGYNFLYTEKGKIRKHEITEEISLIAYWVMEDIIFNIALQYATNNREDGKDFRRKLFAREKEIWKMLNQEGYNKKCLEIDNILKKNPYRD